MADKNKNTALSPGHLLDEERVLRIPPSSTIKNDRSDQRIKVYNSRIRVATWNVRSLYAAGKLANVELDMRRLKIDILGMSEVRWPGSGKQTTNSGVIYYSGGTDAFHRYGTAILVSKDIDKSVIEFIPFNDRVTLLKLQTTHRNLNIIQIYAPTNDKSDAEVEDFYSVLDEAMKHTKKGEINMVIGDFNAKIGSGKENDVVGQHGLGERNTRGDRLVQFCTELDLFIANTFFKQHPRRLYTWKSPGDNAGRIIRNQIDFILVGQVLKKYVQTVKTYPGADINSDHNPVVMDFRMRRFKKISRPQPTRKINTRKLLTPNVHTQVSSKIECKMAEIQSQEQLDVEEIWNRMKSSLTQIQVNDIGYPETNMKKEWMTPEILELMNKRRTHKANPTLYAEMNRRVRRECRDAKEKWMSEKCHEIERLQEKHDTFNLHKKVKEMANCNKKRPTAILRDKNNDIVLGINNKLRRWKEYVEELFNDSRPNTPPEADEDINESGPEITKGEIIHAIKTQRDGKATGPDNIHAEVMKLIAEQEGKGLQLLTSIFNTIYRTGIIPKDWLRSTFITLPKTTHASNCDEYRMISLMSHVLKIFLRVIHTRIYKKCEYQMDETQFGFRSGLGTREALFALNVLTQRCRDMNVNLVACFIDYKKAFDCVKHHKLIEILKTTGIDREEIRLISNLYWKQSAVVKIEETTSEAIMIRKGVRQGCVLSPLLFNIYSEAIFKEALDGIECGIKVNGKIINNIRYADDTVVLAENARDLQRLMNHIVRHSENAGLLMNTTKTKVIAFAKEPRRVRLIVGGTAVEQVSSYKYLGSIVNDQCDPRKEVRCRIEQARKTFMNMRRFFVRSDLSLGLRVRMVRCYVFSVLLYGCESWTLDMSLEKKINAFEMYIYRRILRISWTQRITNEEVLNRMRKQRELMLTIKERKTRYIGHIMRGEKYELLRMIIEGKIQGKRSVGRRQNSWLKDIRRWFGCSSLDIFRMAVSRTTLAIWIANLREETAP